MKSVRANGLGFAYLEQGTGRSCCSSTAFPIPRTRGTPRWPRSPRRAIAPSRRSRAATSRRRSRRTARTTGDTLGRDVLALIEALGEQQRDRRRPRLGRERGVHRGGARAGARAAARHGRDPASASVKPTPKLALEGAPLLRRSRQGARRRLRANDFAYIDELWRRWSPAWKDIPAERDRAR